MRLDPRLIPRLNVEYGFSDLLKALDSSDSRDDPRVVVTREWEGYHPLFVDSGRTALFVCLRMLGLVAGSRVGVPLYTCEAVFQAIKRAQCMPVFLDIDPKTYTISPEALAEHAASLDAVIPIHLFGQPADIRATESSAGEIPIIEDCAHAVGTLVGDRKAGTIGDASFFSFRLGKVITAGNAGMILIKDARHLAQARAIWAQLPGVGPLRDAVDAFGFLLRAMLYRRPWFGLVALPVGSLVDTTLDLMGKFDFNPRQASPGALNLLTVRLLELEARVAAARRNGQLFGAALECAGLEPPVENPVGRHSYFQFPIRFPNADSRVRAIARLAASGVDSIPFYHDSPDIARSRYGYRPGSCPVTEEVAQTLLTVPCHSRLTTREVEVISAALESLGRDL